MTQRAERFQAAVLELINPAWREYVQSKMAEAERRRPRAAYNTGTISEAACLYLHALTMKLQTKVAIEIGTFIGTSTTMMAAAHVYTCDKSNDCLESSARVTCFPHTGSKRMLSTLVHRNVKADFFFFDGRIRESDPPFIHRLSKPTTVYAFDDYEGNEKGVMNVARLHPELRGYVLIPPPASVLELDSKTTIAALVPEALL